MADLVSELNERFAPHNASLPADILGELQSIINLHSLSAQDLYYKWEYYCIKMGAEDTKLDLKTARDLKKDIQDALERESRGKSHMRGTGAMDKKGHGATPRTVKAAHGGGGDVFGMMDGVVAPSGTPRVPMAGVNGNAVKRKSEFDTPAGKVSKTHATSSPLAAKDASTTPVGQQVQFSERQNAGQIVESLNAHIEMPEPPTASSSESRVKLKANSDLSKFSYKPMAMKLSGASEILDDRIDAFVDLVQAHHSLEDGAFGNPAVQSTNEIVAVGRIASDTNEGKLNAASIVLESSRRMGAGLRVPLNLDATPNYDFFPGKIVALRGTNASGEYFTVSEILQTPLLNVSASPISDIDVANVRVAAGDTDGNVPRPLNIIVSSGPYTADSNLDFEPLQALCDKARESSADALILIGPFLDVEHPLIAMGDIPTLPPSLHINQDTATMVDVFRGLISLPIQRLIQAVPNITVVMVPSVRDAVNKHVSWPQDKMLRKELNLPKQVAMVTNPVLLSLNEIILGISAQDVLYELRQESCAGPAVAKSDEGKDLLARLSRHLIEQRHFYPIFPPASRASLPKPAEGDAAGAMLDVSYLALGEWQHVRPDLLITPSALAPFAKVVESVVVVNPGTLSKKRGPGTFAQMSVQSRQVSDEEREADDQMVSNRLYERARVDVVRI